MEIRFSIDSSLRKIVKGLLWSSVPRSKALSWGNSVHRLASAQLHIKFCARLRCRYLLVAPPLPLAAVLLLLWMLAVALLVFQLLLLLLLLVLLLLLLQLLWMLLLLLVVVVVAVVAVRLADTSDQRVSAQLGTQLALHFSFSGRADSSDRRFLEAATS